MQTNTSKSWRVFQAERRYRLWWFWCKAKIPYHPALAPRFAADDNASLFVTARWQLLPHACRRGGNGYKGLCQLLFRP
jgi:hypothetical protein